MKDLNVYIEELLYKHQCVIIPKFGAFISNRKSAKMADDNSFAPPKRELSFNASLNSNDGLLMKYISEQSGIDYNLVEDYVNLAVEGWKRILQQEQPLKLDKIGTLRQSREGRISFEAADDVNYLTDSFGMTPFVPHEIPAAVDLQIAENQIKPTLNTEPELPPEEKSLTTIDSPISQAPPTIPAPEINFNAVPPQTGTPTQNKKTFKLRPYIKYTAVAAVGLAILAYGAYLFFGEKVMSNDPNEQNFAVTDSLVQERLNQKLSEAGVFSVTFTLDPIVLEPEKVKTKSTPEQVKPSKPEQNNHSKPEQPAKPEQNKPNKPEQPKPESTKPVKNNTSGNNAIANDRPTSSPTPSKPSPLASKKYQVIAGAFKEEKNAQARVRQLQKIGYKNAFVLGMNAKGLYQVSYGGFDSMDEAKLQQKEVQASKEEKKLDGGWILTQP
nr:SPOR domain-containing protein [uncultured Capnocytophaga sp.]